MLQSFPGIVFDFLTLFAEDSRLGGSARTLDCKRREFALLAQDIQCLTSNLKKIKTAPKS